MKPCGDQPVVLALLDVAADARRQTLDPPQIPPASSKVSRPR
jgi:hypothetical protein